MADKQTTAQNVEQGAPGTDAGAAAPSQVALSPFLEAVRRPIPGDNPCGKDVSYDDDYLAIKAEIDKLGTVSARVDQERAAELRQMMDATRGTLKKADRAEAEKQLEQRGSVVQQAGGADYQLIKDRATRILSEKSKDIRVASYLCYALWQKELFSGLTEGLSAIDILVCEFWDGLYPPKTRPGARKAAVEFLTSKLGESVEYSQVKADDREPLERAKGVLDGLQKHFTEKMPENPPSLLGLAQAVEKCLNKVPRPAPPVTPLAPGSAPSAAQAAEAGSAAPPAIGELRTSQDAVDLVKKAAKFMRDQNRKNPSPYRLVRSLRWDALAALPPNESGKTKFEAPAAQRRNFLSGLRDAGDWNKLLDECELSFGNPGFHFWLDMQRLTVAALDALGGDFLGVRTAVLSELAILLQRVPKLSSLMFSDGTRFADPATSDWIEETVMPVLGAAESGGAVPGVRFGDGELDTQFVEAKKVLDSGDLAGAIALLQAGANNDNSRKSAFRRKLAMATLCMRGNQPSIARPLLEDLYEDIDKFSIDEWEPALTLEVWTNLHKCYGSLAAGPSGPGKVTMQQLADKVFEKICRLDVGYALASTGAKPKTKRPARLPKPDAQQNNGTGVVDETKSESVSEPETKLEVNQQSQS